MPIFDESLFDGGSPAPLAAPPDPPEGYLGRFQLGQLVPLAVIPVDSLGFPGAPDAAPVATITAPDNTTLAVVKLAMAGGPTSFALPYFLGVHLPLGTYGVSYSFVVAGVAGTAAGSFDLIGGGDAGGRVISMYGYDRPEATYVVVQIAAGRIVQGRNPQI